MVAHEWVLWPGLILAALVGSSLVGRRLGRTRQGVLGITSVVMVIPVGFTAEVLAGQESFLVADRLGRYSVYAGLALLALWGLTELLVLTGLWDRIVEHLRLGAIGIVALVPVGVLLFWVATAGGLEEGTVRFSLAVYLYRAGFVFLFSGGALASLLPLALAWPRSSPEPARLVRLAGTAALVPVLMVPATAGLAIHDSRSTKRSPPGPCKVTRRW